MVKDLWLRGQQFSQARPGSLDAMIAALLLVIALASLVTHRSFGSADGVPPLVWGLVSCGIAPLFFRRRAPLLVLVLSSLPILGLISLGFTPGVLGASLFLCCYTVGALSDTRKLVAGMAYTAAMLLTVTLAWPQYLSSIQTIENIVLFGTSFALGRSARSRRAAMLLAERQAAQLAAQQVELARQRVTAERLNIARELHDLVAHSLGVIAVQAGVASHVADTDPQEVRRALQAITTTSRESLREVRGLLGVLRSDTDVVDYEPRTSLADVPRLLERTRSSGVPVELTVSGELEPLPAGVELAACAVIQEGLANVVRHAHGAPAQVLLERASGRLGIEIRNQAGTEVLGGQGAGHGLAGMRERVHLWGGSMDAAPTADGGFRLRVELPIGGPA